MAKPRLHIVFVLVMLASICSAQRDLLQERIGVKHSTATIEQFLDTIQHKTNVEFVYSNAIQPNNVVSVQTGDYVVSRLLDSIFKNQSVLYVARGNLIILSPQQKETIESERVVVEGQVVNTKKEPIPYATIYIENKSLGTLTNAEGRFRFVLPEKNSADTLIVSCLGYLNTQITPSEYLTQILEVELKPHSIPLKEVVVRPENPDYIVRESYSRISGNYSKHHVILNGFFREASKQDEDYISLSEALIEIKKSSYSSQLNDLVKLVKGRNGTNTKQSELVNLVIEGGLYNGLRLDVVKYQSYFYGEDMFEECDFSMQKRTYLNGRHTYVVGFKAKEDRDYASYDGRLYFDVETLALVRAEFELSKQGVKFARDMLVKKRPRGFKVKPMYANYMVEYRFYNNVWNLHYARSDLGIKVKKVRGKENKGFICDFTSTSEFVITGMSTNSNKKIPFKAVSKSNDILVEQLANSDKIFWANENVIIPEEPLQKTIVRLQEQGEIPLNEAIE